MGIEITWLCTIQVIGRVNPQIKQLRKGLKETKVWQILSQRPDVAELVFPREGCMDCNPKVTLSEFLILSFNY